MTAIGPDSEFRSGEYPGQTEQRWPSLALAIVAIELAVMFVGAIMPTPLYPLYRDVRFFRRTLTLIYAVYVLGNLAALLFFGRLADQIGRRKTT